MRDRGPRERWYLGELIEYGATDHLFVNPRDKRTQDYITGRHG